MVAYNCVKLQRKIITYLITWDVILLHPHISGIFLANVHLHGLIQFLKYSQFHVWYLLSIILMCGCLWFLSMGCTWKIKCMQWTLTHEKNWKQVSGKKLTVFRKLNPCKYTFPEKMSKMWGSRRTIFPTSHVIRYMIIFLCNFTQLYAAVHWGIAFDLPAGTWAISCCHRQPLCCRRHLSERHCMSQH